MERGISIAYDDELEMIALYRDAIRVINKKNSLAVNPIGVVSILPAIQIKLGRTMAEFVDMIKMVQRPIGVQQIYKSLNKESWNIILLGKEASKNILIGSIVTTDDIVTSVSFNQDILYREEYRQEQKLSIMHMLTIGASEDINKAKTAISIITNEDINNFKAYMDNKKIVIVTDIESLSRQYYYTFCKDSKNYYNLLKVWIKS